MAGDWIPIQTDLSRRREVLLISRRTGRSLQEVIGFLVDFWSWASSETDDGNIYGVNVDVLVSTVGADSTFWDALAYVGWLTHTQDGINLPNFDHWLSDGAKSRLRKTRRQKRWRDGQKPTPPNVDGCAPTTGQDRTGQDSKEEGAYVGEGVGDVKPRFLAAKAKIPSALDTRDFREAWKAFCAYRSAKRRPISELSYKQLMTKLERAGPAIAVAAIDESISNDWQGVFPDRIKNQPQGKFDGIQTWLEKHDDQPEEVCGADGGDIEFDK